MQQQIHARYHGAQGGCDPFKLLDSHRSRVEPDMGGIDGNRTTYRRGSEILEEAADARQGVRRRII
jgi:hypothetical protein